MKRTRTLIACSRLETQLRRAFSLFVFTAMVLALVVSFSGCDFGTYNRRFDENRVNKPGPAAAPVAPTPASEESS
ncbi:MAG: hypothetical protein AAF456_24105 [Planctomycetota bacterium]